MFGNRKQRERIGKLVGLFLESSRAMSKAFSSNRTASSARLELYFAFGATDFACQAEGCDSKAFYEILEEVFSRYTGRPSFEGRIQTAHEFSDLVFNQGDRSPTLRSVVELGAHAIRDFVTREGELPLGRLHLVLAQGDELIKRIDRELK